MMDKQQEAQAAAADSISTVGVTVKDYPPSEVYSSEPPPAYVRPRATAVQIARIAAVTLVVVSLILGFSMLASAYITATASCAQYYQDYPPQQEGEDRPSFQHLVDPLDPQESQYQHQHHQQLLQQQQQQAQQKQQQTVQEQKTVQEQQEPEQQQQEKQEEPQDDGDDDSVVILAASHHQDQQPSADSQEKPVQIRLPLQLDFDELAGSLMEKNQRSRMNCVVEKRRTEEVMDHQPKTVKLPFGVNLTTDPRYEHITGERMAIFCESGNEQRHMPMEQQITPVMVPVPIHHAVPVPVPVPQQQMPPQPPRMMPPHPFAIHQLQMQQQQMQQQQMQQQQMQMQQQQMQMQQMQPPQIPPQMLPPQMQSPRMRPSFLPPVLQQQMHLQQLQQLQQMQRMQRMHPPPVQPQVMMAQPAREVEEVPIQIIREEHVIPILQIEREVDEDERQRVDEEPERVGVPADTVRPPPPPMGPPQLTAQALPQQFQRLPPQIHLPIQVQAILPQHQQQQQQQQQLQELDEQQSVMESGRPHYVQPRSVRSVDNVLHRREKRVRRCACDCSC